MERASLPYIFFTFLKLGATAFGGYMSLVAIVQKQLVEIDKKMKEEDLLDGISLTSVLPDLLRLILSLMSVTFYEGFRERLPLLPESFFPLSSWSSSFHGCISPTGTFLP